MTTLQQIMRSTVKDVRSKSVFELSAQELADRLRPTADAVMSETFNRNGYLTYFDKVVCPDASYMVHEYQNRKELVRIDYKGTAHLIKIL
jgi:glycine/serine hydroxymethyltransferase